MQLVPPCGRDDAQLRLLLPATIGGSIPALPRHRRRHVPLRGYGRAGTQNDRLGPPRRGGRFEYRQAHTHAMEAPSAMPICSYFDIRTGAGTSSVIHEKPGPGYPFMALSSYSAI